MMHALPSVDGVLNRSHMHGVLHVSMSPQPAVGEGRALAESLRAGPDWDFGAFEGAVVGAFGPDFQLRSSRKRRQIQCGFEVSPGMMTSAVTQDGLMHQDISVRIDQRNGVRGFGVARVAVNCEGV